MEFIGLGEGQGIKASSGRWVIESGEGPRNVGKGDRWQGADGYDNLER